MAEGACDGANGLGSRTLLRWHGFWYLVRLGSGRFWWKTLKLYSLMTTKPEEVEARKQKEMEE